VNGGIKKAGADVKKESRKGRGLSYEGRLGSREGHRAGGRERRDSVELDVKGKTPGSAKRKEKTADGRARRREHCENSKKPGGVIGG